MIFIYKHRPDRIGTEILSILFQFYYCYMHNYFFKYDQKQIRFADSVFIASIFKIITKYNNELIKMMLLIYQDQERPTCVMVWA